MPEVTVVIPTRDRAARLPDAIAGVLGQEDVDLDLVVVDDGSRDETPSLLASLDDPRLEVVRHERGKGVAAARNRGIASARGRWVAFLDDDDLWAPRKLRHQLDAAALGAASFAYGSAVVVDEHRTVLQYNPARPPASIAQALLHRNAIPGGCSNAIATAELLELVGGFDESLSHLADWDLWIRLALAGQAAATSEVVVAYVRHGGNMLMQGQNDVIGEFQRLAHKHRAAGERAGVKLDRRALYRYFARGHRRAGRHRQAASTYLALAVAEKSLPDAARAAAALVGPPAYELRARMRSRMRRQPPRPLPDVAWLGGRPEHDGL